MGETIMAHNVAVIAKSLRGSTPFKVPSPVRPASGNVVTPTTTEVQQQIQTATALAPEPYTESEFRFD